jgi:3-oxoacyl-[acyl-carrier protein] reductase
MIRIDLTGKQALVTGGARGIGKACAETLTAAGARAAVADINLDGARATAAQLKDGYPLYLDLGDPLSISDACRTLRAEFGKVDILINCGGIISYRMGVGAVTLDEWDKILDVNLRGTFLLCKELMEEMKQLGWARIVNFSSMAARVGGIEAGIHYAASKAGLIGLTKTLAREGGPYGLTANAVAPGVITTDPVKAQVGDHEEAYTRTIPLRRLGEPQDVANVVLFLSSPLSDYMTGLVLDINGGMYMG